MNISRLKDKTPSVHSKITFYLLTACFLSSANDTLSAFKLSTKFFSTLLDKQFMLTR